MSAAVKAWSVACPWSLLQFLLRTAGAFCCLIAFELARSRGTHGRSILCPLGRTRYPFVQMGNTLASRMALVMWHSVSHGSRFFLEQPAGSALALHPRVAELFQKIPTWRVGMWGGAWAAAAEQGTPKRHWLWSNDEMLLRRVETAAGRMSGAALAALCGPALTKKRTREDGTKCWSGQKVSMKGSQRLVLMVSNARLKDLP